MIDGLAFGVLPEAARCCIAACRWWRWCIIRWRWKAGSRRREAERLRDSERAALAATRRVVATSRIDGRSLAATFDVPAGSIDVIVPGTDRGAVRDGSDRAPLRLLAVGAIVPRKGFDVLVEALARLADLPWRLTIVGDRTRDLQAVAASRRRHRAPLAGRTGSRTSGAVSSERLAALYAGADLFVLASRFEGYGMAYAEAIAHGLPVVGTTGGAIPRPCHASAGMPRAAGGHRRIGAGAA